VTDSPNFHKRLEGLGIMTGGGRLLKKPACDLILALIAENRAYREALEAAEGALSMIGMHRDLSVPATPHVLAGMAVRASKEARAALSSVTPDLNTDSVGKSRSDLNQNIQQGCQSHG